MQDNTNLTLETDRLILREFRVEDCHDVQEIGEEYSKSFIKTVLAQQKEQPRVSYQFALINKPDEKLIGHCGFYIKSIENEAGEIGYALNRSYWNQGYMTEAVRRVVDFGFTQLGLHRIYSSCDPGNIGSYRVMEKLGMKREGYLREHTLWKGIWRDSLLYAILDKEWTNHQDDSVKKVDEENDGGREIEYLEKNQNDLDIIRPLWEKLNAHHLTVSRYFKERRAAFTFDMRKKGLMEKSFEGALRIDLARDVVTKEYIGYCVTTVNKEKEGEIESIYVEKDYRLSGIGDGLMSRALAWLENVTVKQTVVGVAEGNEGVFAFYQRHNFYPKVTVLMQKPEISAEAER